MSASLRKETEVTGHEGGLEAGGPWRAMAKAVYVGCSTSTRRAGQG